VNPQPQLVAKMLTGLKIPQPTLVVTLTVTGELVVTLHGVRMLEPLREGGK